MKTRKNLLDYSKKVLEAVSFDRALFKKEYRKALLGLTSDESKELKYWVRNDRSQINLKNLK